MSPEPANPGSSAPAPTAEIFPLTLRSGQDRLLVPSAGIEKPFYVPRSQRNASEIVRTVRQALDHGAGLRVDFDSTDPSRLLAVRLAVPEDQLKSYPCPDNPRFTEGFWKRQAPGPVQTDMVRWIVTSGQCHLYRVLFWKAAAVYYLHESHPKAKEILLRAQASIDEAREVRWSPCQELFNFVSTLEF